MKILLTKEEKFEYLTRILDIACGDFHLIRCYGFNEDIITVWYKSSRKVILLKDILSNFNNIEAGHLVDLICGNEDEDTCKHCVKILLS